MDAPPTPSWNRTETYVQEEEEDEADTSMTYNKLSVHVRLRKIDKRGVYGRRGKLLPAWGDRLS